MKKKAPANDILIHITAKSKFISSIEIIPEKKAVRRLEDIRNNFEYMKRRFDKKGDEVLTVTTGVHNPKLFP